MRCRGAACYGDADLTRRFLTQAVGDAWLPLRRDEGGAVLPLHLSTRTPPQASAPSHLGVLVTVSRCSYMHGFATYGLRAIKGHEVHISDSFLGQYYWGETGADQPAGRNLTGVAVQIDGQDHWIDSIVVFSALYGVVLHGGALVMSDSHIYNGGEAALMTTSHAVRVFGCYFDNNPVVLVDPIAVDVSHNMFLGGVSIFIESSGRPGAFVSGLHLTHNQFIVGPGTHLGATRSAIVINETAGLFTAFNSSVVQDNAVPPATYGPFLGTSMDARSTNVARTVVSRHQRLFTVDFSSTVLLTDCSRFPLSHVLVSLEATMGFPRAVRRPAAPASTACVVTVETDVAFNGTLTVSATQATT